MEVTLLRASRIFLVSNTSLVSSFNSDLWITRLHFGHSKRVYSSIYLETHTSQLNQWVCNRRDLQAMFAWCHKELGIRSEEMQIAILTVITYYSVLHSEQNRSIELIVRIVKFWPIFAFSSFALISISLRIYECHIRRKTEIYSSIFDSSEWRSHCRRVGKAKCSLFILILSLGRTRYYELL